MRGQPSLWESGSYSIHNTPNLHQALCLVKQIGEKSQLVDFKNSSSLSSVTNEDTNLTDTQKKSRLSVKVMSHYCLPSRCYGVLKSILLYVYI